MHRDAIPLIGNMRKTSDLVNEMLEAAKGAWLVAIAVGYENETRFVFSSQAQPLADLNQMIQKGGNPVGLLRFEKEGSQVQGSYRPFDEFSREDWAAKYLAGLLDNTDEIVRLGQQKSPPTAY
jgi:hypothetical protein